MLARSALLAVQFNSALTAILCTQAEICTVELRPTAAFFDLAAGRPIGHPPFGLASAISLAQK
jgi:hypothetical protein